MEVLVAPEDPGVRNEYSKEEVRAICRKHEGKLIAFYGDVFRVERCQRRAYMDNKNVYRLQREGVKVTQVDNDVIAALPEGEAIDLAQTVASARSCKQLEGHYVTYSNVDVYVVEKCKKRLFPDWETYIQHREKGGDKKAEILALSWIEFSRIGEGKPLVSVLDDMFRKLASGDAGVDVIPVDEACRGLEGRVASYYSHLYRVERCRKREIEDPNNFFKTNAALAKVKVAVMTSEQWLSLPNGRPVVSEVLKRKNAPASE